MRDAVIAARAALPLMRQQIGATERELEAERRHAADARAALTAALTKAQETSDAAVAVSFALGVVEPDASGVGPPCGGREVLDHRAHPVAVERVGDLAGRGVRQRRGGHQLPRVAGR